MKTEEPKSQVQKLMDALLMGIKVDRVYAWRHLRIADLRSRVSDLQREYNVTLDRETVPNKMYRRYFFKSLV